MTCESIWIRLRKFKQSGGVSLQSRAPEKSNVYLKILKIRKKL